MTITTAEQSAPKSRAEWRRAIAGADLPKPVDPAWEERALCSQTDPEAFFPEKGGSTREARRVCSRCEVRADCLADALGSDERFGIRGGLSERERRKMLRKLIDKK